jgi:hypothetical protein
MTANLFLFFIVAVTVPHRSATQENSVGIFLTQKLNKNCQRTLFTPDRKIKVCIPEKPIIWPEEFTGVTEIITDEANDFSSFALLLSHKGHDKIKRVIEQLAETELVLVVDNTVVGFVKNKNQIVNKSIQVNGTAHSGELKRVFERLQKIISSENK